VRAGFVVRYQSMHRFVTEANGTVTLVVGAENWPFPIPLVNKQGKWYFDTDAGKDEIVSGASARMKLRHRMRARIWSKRRRNILRGRLLASQSNLRKKWSARKDGMTGCIGTVLTTSSIVRSMR